TATCPSSCKVGKRLEELPGPEILTSATSMPSAEVPLMMPATTMVRFLFPEEVFIPLPRESHVQCGHADVLARTATASSQQQKVAEVETTFSAAAASRVQLALPPFRLRMRKRANVPLRAEGLRGSQEPGRHGGRFPAGLCRQRSPQWRRILPMHGSELRPSPYRLK